MIEKLHKMEPYALLTSKEQIWHNYLMMQVFDRLSLFFCSNYDIVAVATSGSHTKEGAGYYGPSIKPTPVKPGEPKAELKLQVVDNKTVIVEPYPFDETPLRVSVRGKLIPKIKYHSQEEFLKTYSKAQRQLCEFTLRAA